MPEGDPELELEPEKDRALVSTYIYIYMYIHISKIRGKMGAGIQSDDKPLRLPFS